MKIRHTILVGAGGIGGWFAEPASRLLAHHPEAQPFVTIIDKDTFDEGNASRQAASDAVGRNKASVLAARCMSSAQDTNFRIVPHFIYGDDIIHQIAEADHAFGVGPSDGVVLIVTAVDNDFARAEIMRALADHESVNYLLVNPGNEYDDWNVSCEARIAGMPIGPRIYERFPQYAAADPKQSPGHEGCSKVLDSHPQLVTANMAAALAALTVVENWLADETMPLLLTGKTRSLTAMSNGAANLPGWDAVAPLLGMPAA